MPNVMIKQFGDHIACSGISLGGPAVRRKLFPGEVVTIPEDLLETQNDGSEAKLIDILSESGLLEITRKPATRPLDYPDERTAKLCSPMFKPNGIDQERDMEEARARVAEFMAQQQPSMPAADEAPPADSQSEAPTGMKHRRRGRRTAPAAGQHEQGHTA